MAERGRDTGSAGPLVPARALAAAGRLAAARCSYRCGPCGATCTCSTPAGLAARGRGEGDRRVGPPVARVGGARGALLVGRPLDPGSRIHASRARCCRSPSAWPASSASMHAFGGPAGDLDAPRLGPGRALPRRRRLRRPPCSRPPRSSSRTCGRREKRRGHDAPRAGSAGDPAHGRARRHGARGRETPAGAASPAGGPAPFSTRRSRPGTAATSRASWPATGARPTSSSAPERRSRRAGTRRSPATASATSPRGARWAGSASTTIEVFPLGDDAALARGAWRLDMTDGKEPHGLFTLLLRRLDGAWRIVHDHTSSGE